MSGSISFYNEDITYQLRGIRKTRAWIQLCIEKEQQAAGEISIIFCSDDYLYKMNVEYLKHDTLTDVITFDYTEAGLISGDVFISIPRVRENAKAFGRAFSEEIHRVMIHGIMHLCGYKDKSTKERAMMRAKEEECLSLIP